MGHFLHPAFLQRLGQQGAAGGRFGQPGAAQGRAQAVHQRLQLGAVFVRLRPGMGAQRTSGREHQKRVAWGGLRALRGLRVQHGERGRLPVQDSTPVKGSMP